MLASVSTNATAAATWETTWVGGAWEALGTSLVVGASVVNCIGLCLQKIYYNKTVLAARPHNPVPDARRGSSTLTSADNTLRSQSQGPRRTPRGGADKDGASQGPRRTPRGGADKDGATPPQSTRPLTPGQRHGSRDRRASAASLLSLKSVASADMSPSARLPGPSVMRQTQRRLCVWVAGVTCMMLGALMDFAALPLIPLSRIAVLGACTMIVNVFIAPCFLDDETVTCHDIVGCLLAVMGTTMACVFGQKKERALSSDELFDCLTSAGFLKYAVVVTVLLAIMRWNIECFKRKWSAAQEKQIISRHSALETTWAHDNLHLLERLPREFCFPFVTKLGPQFYPCVHAVYAGVIGAHSVMFSKIALGFARNAVAHGCCDLVSVASALVAIVPLVFCLVSQLFYLNRALETYRYQLFVAPNYQSAWILTGVVVGMVLYQERDGLSSHAAPLFSFGLLFTLLGLAVVAQRPASPSQVMVTLPATPVSVPLQGVWSANADARSSPTPMSPLFPGTELHAGSFIPADMLPDGQYAGAPPDEATALLPVAARAAAAEERRSPPAPATLRLE